MNKTNFYLFLFALFLTIQSEAQTYYKEGKIVTLKNDTINGFIRDGGEIKNSNLCKYKANRKSKPKYFKPGEIKAYKFTGGKYYSSQQVLINGTYQPRFAEVLVDGNISLYYYWKNNEALYYLKKSDGRVIGLLNDQITILPPEANGSEFYNKRYIIHSFAYKDSLLSIFEDDGTLRRKIYELEYKQKPMMDLVKEYNKNSCPNTNCLNYEKDLRAIKPTTGFYTGVQISKARVPEYLIESTVAHSFMLGIYHNIPLTLISNTFSFQIEFNLKSTDYNQVFSDQPYIIENLNIENKSFGVPLLLKYKIQQKKFSYNIDAGKEFSYIFKSAITYQGRYLRNDGVQDFGDLESTNYKFRNGGWLVDLGSSYKLNSKLSAFINFRYQFFNDLMLEDVSDNRLTFNTAYKKTRSHKYQTNCLSVHLGLGF